jgi:hypothetical protein
MADSALSVWLEDLGSQEEDGEEEQNRAAMSAVSYATSLTTLQDSCRLIYAHAIYLVFFLSWNLFSVISHHIVQIVSCKV